MKKTQLAALLAIAGASAAGSAQALIINPTGDANTLSTTILGSGIAISNVRYTGDAAAAGTFSDGLASGLGINSGIILTTGAAANAVGPNVADDFTKSNFTAGDTNLDALVAPLSTNDASVLEFDFTTTGGNVFFNYVFASEEYNEFTHTQFNDVFGFFLDGVNIALIPGTTTPVSINSVNGLDNTAYYNDNERGTTSVPFNIEYDGFTDVFTATALGLTSGLHRIKLAIADTSDTNFDSAVFIQARTFSDTTTVPEPSALLLMALGLAGFGMARNRVSKV